MKLDIPTLTLILTLVYLANIVFSLMLYFSRNTFKGAFLWIVGQILVGLGFLGLMFRPYLPGWISIALTNGAFVTAMVFYAHSVWTFRFASPFPQSIYAIGPVFFVVFLGLLDQSFNVRAIVFSIVQAIECLAVAALLLYRIEKPMRFASTTTAVPFLLIAIANVVRIPANWSATEVVSFNAQDGINAVFYLFSILTGAFTLFGYFLMSSVRQEKMIVERDAQIETRNQELVELNHAKTLFFSIIAHDLRTPIVGAARYVHKHLLGKSDANDSKRKELETLAVSLDKTSDFLDKLLWWTRAQQDEWVVQSLDLTQIMEALWGQWRQPAAAKGIELVDTVHVASLKILAHRESIELILSNLLSNAVKYSPRGCQVRWNAGYEGADVVLKIWDNGIGIPKENLDKLFRIDSKFSTTGTNGEVGSGMGLILAKILVERNAGRLEVKSKDGTEVRLVFPALAG